MSLSSATSHNLLPSAGSVVDPVPDSITSSEPRLLGVLTVVVIRAKNLPDKSIVGKQSPYVTFKYGEESRKTKVKVKGGQHPVFDEEVRFNIHEDAEDILERVTATDEPPTSNGNLSTSLSATSSTCLGSSVSGTSSVSGAGAAVKPISAPRKKAAARKSMLCAIFADDSKEPRLVGETMVDLAKVLKDCEHDGWYTLMYKDRYAGEVSLELTYFINSAPPIPKKVAKTIVRPDYGGPGTFHPSNSSSSSTNSQPGRDPRRNLASSSMANLRPQSSGSPMGMSPSQTYSHGSAGGSHRMSMGSVSSTTESGSGDWATMLRQNSGGGGSGGGGGGGRNLGVIDEMGGRIQPRRGSFSGVTQPYGTYPSAQQGHPPPNAYETHSLTESLHRMSMSGTPSGYAASSQSSPHPPSHTLTPPPLPYPGQYNQQQHQQHRHSLPGTAARPDPNQWIPGSTEPRGGMYGSGGYDQGDPSSPTYFTPPNLPQPPGVRGSGHFLPPSTSFPQLAPHANGTFSPPPMIPASAPAAHGAYPQHPPGPGPGPAEHQRSSYDMPGAFPPSSTAIPTSSFPQLSRPTPPPTQPAPAPLTNRNSYPDHPSPPLQQQHQQPTAGPGNRSATPLPLVDNRPPMTMPYSQSGPPPLPPASTRPPSTVPGYYSARPDAQQYERPLPQPTPALGGYPIAGTSLPLAGYAPPAQVPYDDPYTVRTPSMADQQSGRHTPTPHQIQTSHYPTPPSSSLNQYPAYEFHSQPHGQQYPAARYPSYPPPTQHVQQTYTAPIHDSSHASELAEQDKGYRRRSAGISYLATLGVGQGSVDPQPAYGGPVNSQQVPPPPSGQMYQGQYVQPHSHQQQQQQWSDPGQQQSGEPPRNGAGGWNDLPPPLPQSLAGRGNWTQ